MKSNKPDSAAIRARVGSTTQKEREEQHSAASCFDDRAEPAQATPAGGVAKEVPHDGRASATPPSSAASVQHQGDVEALRDGPIYKESAATARSLVAGPEYRLTLACGHVQTYHATSDGQTHLGRAHCWTCDTRETITDLEWLADAEV